MHRTLLPDRGLIAVGGDEAQGLLNRLFTRDMVGMDKGKARYAALLSPQGKLLFDFLVYRHADGFWIDVAQSQAADLARKLVMFKLRAKVTVENRSDVLVVAAAWEGALMAAPGSAFRDPRHNELGYRIVARPDELRDFSDKSAAYTAHRIELGVPEGGTDFVYGDSFVHDANLDLLHGVDFDKGCYVGQEVVSRVHHRSSARKRIVRLDFFGGAPAIGAALTAGALQIGQVTSIAGQSGLATARIDRLEEAESTNLPVMAGDTLVGIRLPTKSTVTPPSYAEDVF